MGLEQRHDDALQPEAEAGGVRDRAVGGADAERLSEFVLVVVERADGGRIRLGDDRDQDLELQLLFALATTRSWSSTPATCSSSIRARIPR